jgi:hypothetical protein
VFPRTISWDTLINSCASVLSPSFSFAARKQRAHKQRPQSLQNVFQVLSRTANNKIIPAIAKMAQLKKTNEKVKTAATIVP